MLAAIETDYLFVEPLLIRRLENLVGSMASVLSVNDLADVEEHTQVTPAVHVCYYGDQVTASDAKQIAGSVHRVAQEWLVVVVERNAAQDGAAMRASVGGLFKTTLDALMGWKVDGVNPLVRVNAPRPRIRDGFIYLPMLFRVEMTVRPAPN